MLRSPPGKRRTRSSSFRSRPPTSDTVFTFANPDHEFPQRIHYRRATEGWLYATIEGKLNGEDRQVIYPMRRIGCETGDNILK